MGLVGIYSFPKSGNTWVRVIMSKVMQKSVSHIPDLHNQELSDAATFNGNRFFKLHAGQNRKVWNGQQLETTHVIHIRRNPLDVFVSYLNMLSNNVGGKASIPFKSVDAIKDDPLFEIYFHSFIATGHLSSEFIHTTKNYFEHNKYWLNQKSVPVINLRYEDMLADTKSALAPVQELIGVDDETLDQALVDAGKATKPDGKFFWKQQEKNYRQYLTPEQIDLFLKYRGEQCRKIGYTPEDF